MIIAKGAEAVLRKEDNKIIKERITKNYRISQIDEQLRKYRTRREAKSLIKAGEVIQVPLVLNVDDKKMELEMEFIEGEILRDVVEKIDRKTIFKKLGENIRKLHDIGIIHGDLTTSNVIIKEGTPYLIDFGLSITSIKTEDKAVDLHLLRQALESKHFENWEECFQAVLEGYNPDKEFKNRFEKVEGRGRYKQKA